MGERDEGTLARLVQRARDQDLKPWQKKKRPLAAWTRAFPDQAKALHPETGAAGGIKGRSGSKKLRDAIYGPIAAMFKRTHPKCEACVFVRKVYHDNAINDTEDVHHTRGKDGLLLFDVRWFKGVCRECHTWIGDNPQKAAALGLVDLVNWRKETDG